MAGGDKDSRAAASGRFKWRRRQKQQATAHPPSNAATKTSGSRRRPTCSHAILLSSLGSSGKKSRCGRRWGQGHESEVQHFFSAAETDKRPIKPHEPAVWGAAPTALPNAPHLYDCLKRGCVLVLVQHHLLPLGRPWRRRRHSGGGHQLLPAAWWRRCRHRGGCAGARRPRGAPVVSSGAERVTGGALRDFEALWLVANSCRWRLKAVRNGKRGLEAGCTPAWTPVSNAALAAPANRCLVAKP